MFDINWKTDFVTGRNVDKRQAAVPGGPGPSRFLSTRYLADHFITGFRRPALYSKECGSSTDNMFDKWNTYSWDLLALGLDQR